jgi:hypothetical protein
MPLQVGQEIRVEVHALGRLLPIAEIKLWVHDALIETRNAS